MQLRRTAVLVTALAVTTSTAALTAGLASPASAADSTPGYSLQHITVETTIGPAGDRQQCTVDADLYKPDRAFASRKAPSILTTNGFGGSKDDAQESAIGRSFVKQGYVVLTYSGLGFGNSDCKIYLDDPDYDGQAGKQLVSVLAGTKSYLDSTGSPHRIGYVSKNRPGDPRVGMIGGSYGGQIQYAVAEQDQRVDAIIPIITWNDLSYSLAPNNTSLRGVTYRTPGVSKKEWIDLFFGVGISDGVASASSDPPSVTGCPNFNDRACTASVELNTLGYPTTDTLNLARHASVSTYIKKVRAPALIVQGQADTLFNLQESVATFRTLRAQGNPSRLIWQYWGHSDGTPKPGELDLNRPLRQSYLGNRFLNWMNHYVRGTRAPVGPRFSYFRDWVKYDTSPARAGSAISQAYATRSTFSEKLTKTLYLTGNDGLTPDRGAVTTGAQSYANAPGAATSYSETSGLEGNQVNMDPSDATGTFAAYTSPVLAKPADMVGSPCLTVHLDAPAAKLTQSGGPAGKLIFFAKIYDVAPDGATVLQHRLIAPVRVTDVNAPVHVALPGVVQRFPAGHRIQLVLAASDLAYANNDASQPVTVTTTSADPGHLRLPITGALSFR